MGGRGGRSHAGGGGLSNDQVARYVALDRMANQMGIHLRIDSLLNSNVHPRYVRETLNSVRLIYTQFPVMQGWVKYIDAEAGSARAYASAGGDGGLHMGLYGRMSQRELQ